MIPKTANENDLRKLFGTYGEITDIFVMKNAVGVGKG
jgi:RNA recognition motif-containing protein